MADQAGDGDANFLRRWSRRKLAAARPSATEPPPVTTVPAVAAPAAAAPVVAAEKPAVPTGSSLPADPTGTARDEAPPLPPIESLGFDSDFTRFLAPKVDEAVKRQALRKLFNDPRFNVMDGLDVYIDDYSKFEPIPADLVGKLAHARYIFDPPKTRVNEAGHVEDVPDEPVPGPVATTDAQDGAPDAQAVTRSVHEDTGTDVGAPGNDVAQPTDALPPPSENALPPQHADAALPGPAPDDDARECVPAVPDDRAGPR